ncbi:MAG: hypothetical protein A3J74_03075 [Elusimicrobia bacterium RIFCSPHIGHO2_02_FULL_57_9]|nr:MAG: hypothetical protein A3J74_03075 [Elusimicrobia bacterium RIFCSPHIGHO2_02_FULL_57_9]
MSLDQLKNGQSAVVFGYDPALAAERRERFEDIGLVVNTPIRRQSQAPLGDPVIFLVRGLRLCLRRKEARHIYVRPCD